jgi:hypothetical protein
MVNMIKVKLINKSNNPNPSYETTGAAGVDGSSCVGVAKSTTGEATVSGASVAAACSGAGLACALAALIAANVSLKDGPSEPLG